MRLSKRYKLFLIVGSPLVIISVIVMWFTIDRIYGFSIKRLHDQSIQLAKNYADSLDAKFRILAEVAYATAEFMEIIEDLDEETIYEILRSNVNRNPLIYGSAIAFEPFEYKPDRRLFSPYIYRGKYSLNAIDIGAESYDYTDDRWEWFARTKTLGVPVWTEPYFDEGAGNILMETFSVPFYRNSKFRGVTTIDIPLDKLQRFVASEVLHDQPFIIVSSSGKFIAHPDPAMIMHESIQQRSAMSGDPKLQDLSRRLLSGESGVIKVDRLEILSDEPYWIFYAPIKSTGWAFATAVPASKITAFTDSQITRGIIGASILLLFVIVSVIARTREAAAREAVESDLRVAREIQSSLLPDRFPICSEDAKFDLYAINQAARHVGGDFFDFFSVEDEKIMFVIADVSGKGTAAAMVMAIARTIIRNLAKHTTSPAAILKEANVLLIEIEKRPVFVTIFIALYEPATGKIIYANAGHQPPYILDVDGGIRKFGEATGTIVGMLDDAEYAECEGSLHVGDYLIIYTDGIPDSRSPDGHFFGEDCFLNLLSNNPGRTANEFCYHIVKKVLEFQENNLTDDITLLILKRCR